MIPKAGLIRLVKDAGGKLTTNEEFESLQADIEQFLRKILCQVKRVQVFTKRKTVSRSHVEFSLGACGHHALVTKAKKLKCKELNRLHRCNIHAAPSVRRAPTGAVEISEATFVRLLKNLARDEGIQGHFGAQARRLIHLMTEDFVVDRIIADTSSGDEEPTTPSFVLRALQDAYSCSAEAAEVIAGIFEKAAARLDPLLEANSSKTVSVELLQVALDDVVVAPDDVRVPSKAVRIVENLLRGRAPDRWVTRGAIQYLADVLAAEVK